MKRLHIQLQPIRSPELDVSEAIIRLKRLAKVVRVTEGEEDHELYFNIDFKLADLSGLWLSVRQELQAIPGLAQAAIIVCEGEHGWDDYLLLHHFNQNEQLGQLR